jgi:hypothetical protein
MKLHKWHLYKDDTALGVKTGNVNFIKPGYSGQTDFIVILYSVTSSDILSNNKCAYRFRGSVVKTNCV